MLVKRGTANAASCGLLWCGVVVGAVSSSVHAYNAQRVYVRLLVEVTCAACHMAATAGCACLCVCAVGLIIAAHRVAPACHWVAPCFLLGGLLAIMLLDFTGVEPKPSRHTL